MFTRISLIVAVVAAIAAAGLNVIKVRHQITILTADRDTERALKETAQQSLADTTQKLTSTANELKGTKMELSATRVERDEAAARAVAEAQQAASLAATLKAAQGEQEKLMNELAAWKTGSTTVMDSKDILASLKKIVAERDGLRVQVFHLRAEVARLDPDQGEGWGLPRDLKGKVTVCDPKYGFVVLNVGDDQGVLEDRRLLVHRDGKLIAKVIIKSVEATRSIANVLPNWQVAEIREGDQILVE